MFVRTVPLCKKLSAVGCKSHCPALCLSPSGSYEHPLEVRNTKTFSSYGVFVEEIVQLALLSPKEQKLITEEECEMLYNRISEAVPRMFPKQVVKSNHSIHQTMFRASRVQLSQFGLKRDVELIHGRITGHPDFIGSQAVIDCKCTSSWKSMSRIATRQILLYYALAKESGKYPDLKYAGIYFAGQGDLQLADLQEWDYSGFLRYCGAQVETHFPILPNISGKDKRKSPVVIDLRDSSESTESGPVVIDLRDSSESTEPGPKVTDLCDSSEREPNSKDMLRSLERHLLINAVPPNLLEILESMSKNGQIKNIYGVVPPRPFAQVGTHVRGGRGFISSMQKSYPTQVFLRNKLSGICSAETKSLAKKKPGVLDPFQAFVHGVYTLNLAQSESVVAPIAAHVIEDLVLGKALGMKGVVVHVGKSMKCTLPHDNMIKNTIGIAEHASVSCPLLVETPAGQGTEMYTDMEEFQGFFAKLEPLVSKGVVGMCLDTAHVWGSGYDPYKYLLSWDHKAAPIHLVHFNQSKVPCGSRKDRHASPWGSDGLIPNNSMQNVYEYCLAQNIPMVFE